MTDPYQLRNLAACFRRMLDVLDRMRARLTQWEVETRDIGFMDEAEALRLAERTGQDAPRICDGSLRVSALARAGYGEPCGATARCERGKRRFLRDARRCGAVLGGAGLARRPASGDPLSRGGACGGLWRDAHPAVRTEAAAALVALYDALRGACGA